VTFFFFFFGLGWGGLYSVNVISAIQISLATYCGRYLCELKGKYNDPLLSDLNLMAEGQYL